MSVMDTSNLIGTAEAADLLDKSRRSIHRLVDAGLLIPAFTAPAGRHGSYMFDRADVEKLVTDCEPDAEPAA